MSDRTFFQILAAIVLAAALAAGGWWIYDQVHEPSEQECYEDAVVYSAVHGSLIGYDAPKGC